MGISPGTASRNWDDRAVRTQGVFPQIIKFPAGTGETSIEEGERIDSGLTRLRYTVAKWLGTLKRETKTSPTVDPRYSHQFDPDDMLGQQLRGRQQLGQQEGLGGLFGGIDPAGESQQLRYWNGTTAI